MVTDRIINLMQQGIIPWRKPWHYGAIDENLYKQCKADLEEYYQKLRLMYAFNVVLVSGSGSETAAQMAPIIMDKLLRGVVIPNEQAIRYLFKTM